MGGRKGGRRGMKYLLLLFLTTAVWADCNLKTGITKNSDGSFKYTRECHLLMGDWKKDRDSFKAENETLRKNITLKDLSITHHEQRTKLWMDSSYDLEKRLTTIQRFNSTDRWFHFGLGIVATGLSIYLAGQIYR